MLKLNSLLSLPLFLILLACNPSHSSGLKSVADDEAQPFFNQLSSDSRPADQQGVIFSPTIDMKDRNVGFFVGETDGFGAIFKTIDGGASWTLQFTVADKSIDGLSVVNENVAWVSGNMGFVAQTRDGGQTWTQFQTGTEDFSSLVSAVDAEKAWVATSNAILKTTDAGATWSQVVLPDSNMFITAMQFVNSDLGYIVTSSSASPVQAVYVTRDGGGHWTQLKVPTAAIDKPGTMEFLSLSVVDAQHVFLASSLGYVYSSADAGVSIHRMTAVPDGQKVPGCFKFIDSRVGYLAFGDEVLATRDAGASWNKVQTAEGSLLERCDFVDASYGVFLNPNGIVSRAFHQ